MMYGHWRRGVNDADVAEIGAGQRQHLGGEAQAAHAFGRGADRERDPVRECARIEHRRRAHHRAEIRRRLGGFPGGGGQRQVGERGARQRRHDREEQRRRCAEARLHASSSSADPSSEGASVAGAVTASLLSLRLPKTKRWYASEIRISENARPTSEATR